MSELRVGSLALVYGLVVNTEYNGLCVELISQVSKTFEIIDLPSGVQVLLGHGEWLCFHPSLPYEGHASFSPKNLLPIGDKDPDLEKETDNELHKSTEHS